MNMSDTPRTDALISSFPEENDLRGLAGCYNKLLEHARQLEQRNAELRGVLHALLNRNITYNGMDPNNPAAILPFESHDQAMNHIAEARALAKTKE
jgi:hypothetical protein